MAHTPTRPPARPLSLDVRDPRIPGGRLALSAGTSDRRVLEAYRRAVLAVLPRPEGAELVRRLKLTKRAEGKITLQQLADAVRDMTVPELVRGGVDATGGGVAVPRAMLGAMLDRFLQRARSDLQPLTLASYESLIRLMEREFGVVRGPGGKVVKDVAVARIQSSAALTWLKGPKETAGGRPWAAATQRQAHTVAAQVWDLAAADEIERAEAAGVEPPLLRNFWRQDRTRPQASVRPARIRKTRVVFLTRAEAARVLWANRGSHLGAWIALGIYAGLRKGEKRHLRMELDLDLAGGELHIQPRTGAEAWRPKSDHGVRTIDLSRRLARWLRRHVRLGFAGQRYVFRVPGRDAPIGENTACRWTEEAFRLGRVAYGQKRDGMTDHTLRHTFCTWAMQEGNGVADIAAVAGDRIETVVSTYLHHAPRNRRRVVESVARAARKAGAG
jgi:integrase